MHQRSTLKWTTRTLSLAAALVVCLTPAFAQNPSAKVVVQVGQVSVMNGADQQALNVNDTIRMGQIIVTGPDGFARFQVLSDGSTFEVFPNAKVVFRDTPGNWQKLLNVWIGRVKVFIQHAPGVPNPNDVTSPTAIVSVRGTVFDVDVRDEDTTVVSVDEGEVGVRNWTAPGDTKILHPGDTVTVLRNQPLAQAGFDKGGAIQRVLRAARDVFVQMPRTPGGASGPGIPTGTGGSSGGQGDNKGSKTGGSGSGAPPAPPGAAPPPPGAAPPPPGGGGN